jgi:hypothetical protein
MPVIEVAFSDLINKPRITLAPLVDSHTSSIRLRRRDEADLMLTTVTQYEQGQEVIRMAVRLFTALAQHRDLDSMMELLPDVYPWVRFLPDGDRAEFLQEFVDTLRATEELDTVAPLVQLITAWRHTAEIYADPALVAILTQDLGDFGVVPPPPVA